MEERLKNGGIKRSEMDGYTRTLKEARGFLSLVSLSPPSLPFCEEKRLGSRNPGVGYGRQRASSFPCSLSYTLFLSPLFLLSLSSRKRKVDFFDNPLGFLIILLIV